MQVVVVAGMVAQLLATGAWLVAAGASWFIVGYVAVAIFIAASLVFFIAALLPSG